MNRNSVLPLGFSIRLGIVKYVGRTYIDFEFLDKIQKQTFRAPIPHPYAGRGGGILVGMEKDTIVIVASGPGEKYYCIGTIPDHNFYFDLDGAEDLKYNETQYPTIEEGEIILKGNAGQRIDLSQNGNIKFDAGIGSSAADIELSQLSRALYLRTNQQYSFTEAGRFIDGVIRRDMNESEHSSITKTTNFLDSETYDTLLKDIGRFPQYEVQSQTTSLIKALIRNPALVEKRSIIYEYADSFNVQNFEKECDAIVEASDMNKLQKDISSRQNRRTDILNLNLNNFNHLIEKVEGTVVDIYGNILDINRNIINIPDITVQNSQPGVDNKDILKEIYDLHRRSVKLHYEINTRKSIDSKEPGETDKAKYNAKGFSRWSIDVDAEGLTKINIPSSSETGNIPVLSRYFTSRDPENIDSGSFKGSDDRKDIKIQQFGSKSIDTPANFAGQEITDSGYRPTSVDESIVTVGTAFHDLMSIADLIFTNGKITHENDTLKSSTNNGPLAEKINNSIYDNNHNAGGRSANINLDGSVEMSIGADTVDRKSLVIDTAGGTIAHYGRDRNGRSIIQQTDGDVIIQIGGIGISSDNRFSSEMDTENRSGRVEIHLNRTGGTPQKIVIDENGITFDIQKKIYFKSTGDVVFDCGGHLMLNGEVISLYGSSDTNSREIIGSESALSRSGKEKR